MFNVFAANLHEILQWTNTKRMNHLWICKHGN